MRDGLWVSFYVLSCLEDKSPVFPSSILEHMQRAPPENEQFALVKVISTTPSKVIGMVLYLLINNFSTSL